MADMHSVSREDSRPIPEAAVPSLGGLRIHDVDIRAFWTGSQEQAVDVKICIRLDAEAGTRHMLLDESSSLVLCSSVVGIRDMQPAPPERDGSCVDIDKGYDLSYQEQHAFLQRQSQAHSCFADILEKPEKVIPNLELAGDTGGKCRSALSEALSRSGRENSPVTDPAVPTDVADEDQTIVHYVLANSRVVSDATVQIHLGPLSTGSEDERSEEDRDNQTILRKDITVQSMNNSDISDKMDVLRASEISGLVLDLAEIDSGQNQTPLISSTTSSTPKLQMMPSQTDRSIRQKPRLSRSSAIPVPTRRTPRDVTTPNRPALRHQHPSTALLRPKRSTTLTTALVSLKGIRETAWGLIPADNSPASPPNRPPWQTPSVANKPPSPGQPPIMQSKIGCFVASAQTRKAASPLQISKSGCVRPRSSRQLGQSSRSVFASMSGMTTRVPGGACTIRRAHGILQQSKLRHSDTIGGQLSPNAAVAPRQSRIPSPLSNSATISCAYDENERISTGNYKSTESSLADELDRQCHGGNHNRGIEMPRDLRENPQTICNIQHELASHNREESPFLPPQPWLRYGSLNKPYNRIGDKKSSSHGSKSLASGDRCRTISGPGQYPSRAQPTCEAVNGQIWINFSQDVNPGTYEILLQANIMPSEPNTQNWRELSIPVLPCAARHTSEPFPGGFAFYLDLALGLEELPDVEFGVNNALEDAIITPKYILGRFKSRNIPTLLLRRKEAIRLVEEFSMSISMSGTPTISKAGHAAIEYVAQISFEPDGIDKEIFANKLSFPIVLRNGHQPNATYHAEAGVSIILNNGTLKTSDSQAVLEIVRPAEDTASGLVIQFTVQYLLGPRSTPLPSLRPLKGEVISETIFMTMPVLPLQLEYVPTGILSTWSTLTYLESSRVMLRLDRKKMPKFYPDGLREDAHVRFRELPRVSFYALWNIAHNSIEENPVSIVRDLIIKVYNVLGGVAYCSMEVILRVGKSPKLLEVEQNRWEAVYALLNEELTTEYEGQWRATSDGCMTLFNSQKFVENQSIRVKVIFQRSPHDACLPRSEFAGAYNLDATDTEWTLPKVVGKTVLGASLALDFDLTDGVENFRGDDIGTLTGRRQGDTNPVAVFLTDALSMETLRHDVRNDQRFPLYFAGLSPSYRISIAWRKVRAQPHSQGSKLQSETESESEGSRTELPKSIFSPRNSKLKMKPKGARKLKKREKHVMFSVPELKLKESDAISSKTQPLNPRGKPRQILRRVLFAAIVISMFWTDFRDRAIVDYGEPVLIIPTPVTLYSARPMEDYTDARVIGEQESQPFLDGQGDVKTTGEGLVPIPGKTIVSAISRDGLRHIITEAGIDVKQSSAEARKTIEVSVEAASMRDWIDYALGWRGS